MRLIDRILILIYLVRMITIGVVLRKKQSSIEEYFKASGSMGWSLIGLSILGKSISTISYLSFPAKVIAHGPGLLIANIIFPISYIIIAYVFLPVYFKYNVTSIFEYLENRFNANVGLLGVIIFFL